MERLTRNPEKLANVDGRCWKDTLGRKRSLKTHRPPYPTRRGGLVTAWQDTKKLLHDESGRAVSGRTWRGKISKNYTKTGKATKKTNKKEVWKSLVRASSSAQPTEEKKEEDQGTKYNIFRHIQSLPLTCVECVVGSFYRLVGLVYIRFIRKKHR